MPAIRPASVHEGPPKEDLDGKGKHRQVFAETLLLRASPEVA